jgi:hypothetical protein
VKRAVRIAAISTFMMHRTLRATLGQPTHAAWEGRAAIIEYDGGFDRAGRGAGHGGNGPTLNGAPIACDRFPEHRPASTDLATLGHTAGRCVSTNISTIVLLLRRSVCAPRFSQIRLAAS